MRIELTYPAWKAGIITVILISHLMSLTALLENYLMDCRLFKGSRVLVWTLFTITLFSTLSFATKMYREIDLNYRLIAYETITLPLSYLGKCISFSVYSWYLYMMERLFSLYISLLLQTPCLQPAHSINKSTCPS